MGAHALSAYEDNGPSAELGHLEQQFRELEQQGVVFQAEIGRKNAKINSLKQSVINSKRMRIRFQQP